MRHEGCAVTTDAEGTPTSVTWQGQQYAVASAQRTKSLTINLSFHEYWTLQCPPATLRVYSVEYGSAGHRTEKFWWLGAIDPDPRGTFSLF